MPTADKIRKNVALLRVDEAVPETGLTPAHAAKRIVSGDESGSRVIWIAVCVAVLFATFIWINNWIAQGNGTFAARSAVAAISTPKPPDRRVAQLSVGLGLVRGDSEPQQLSAPFIAQLASSACSQPSQFAFKREPQYITVSEGQSLNRIARANHLTVTVIAAANHLESPYQLKVGSRLLIPGASSSSD